MKHLKKFSDLSEGTIAAADDQLKDAFLMAFKAAFPTAKFIRGYGNQDKIYDYSNGYVEHPVTCVAEGWDCVDPKSAKILEACKLSPLTVKAYFFVYEPISKAEPKKPKAWIGFLGDQYLNNTYRFENELTTGKFNKALKDFKAKCIKEGLNDDLLKVLFGQWEKTDYKEAHKDTSNWGHGSQAVTYIKKKFESAYIIRDLDVALNKSRKEVETYIKGHYMFKKDDLKFDWDGGVMYVTGEFGEYWD